MKIGFIGCGNMASAIIGGIISRRLVEPDEIMVSAKTKETLKRISDIYQVRTAQENKMVVEFAEILILAVKPNVLGIVADEIADEIPPEKVIVSIAAGRDLAWLSGRLGGSKKIVRAMPNTPALVGEGMTALCPNANVTEEDLKGVSDIFNSFGRAEVVAEELMPAVTAVSGSSPEYVFMFIEAMADAAVHQGMERRTAYRFAAQTVLGSAKMVLDSGLHIGELRDMLMTPAGTTIEGLRVLEEKGMRGAVMDALIECSEKAKRL
ncbi:MAG: pyrroline-5-carboxylate reductase [Eubacterium sp.]|nr:pyrroline-5-carboxylate reductase [Eubacterium sp.]